MSRLLSRSANKTPIFLITMVFIKHIQSFFVASVLLLVPLALNADPEWSEYQKRIPDNAPRRVELVSMFTDPVSTLSPKSNKKWSQVIAPRSVSFEVRRDTQRGYVYLLFKNGIGNAFPDNAPGNVVVRRNATSGQIEQIKIFLSNEPEMYLRILPAALGSVMSVFFVSDKHPLFREVPLPLSMERAAVTPISVIMSLTDARISWKLFLDVPDNFGFESVVSMASTIRRLLPTLPDADDGAMDENGKLTKISGSVRNGLAGFNCSGFAKWIADGLFFPLMQERTGQGSFLTIAELEKRQIGVRGSEETQPFEELRDPFFGLDWTRNIAAKLYTARTGKIGDDPEAWDLRELDFLQYQEDKGFQVSDLRLALFRAAIKQPGYFYLGAINGEWGTAPVLWQYYHVVALFPYFDAQRRFHCAVFERNVESSIDSLEKRYPTEYIHLVRLKASEDFDPPRIR